MDRHITKMKRGKINSELLVVGTIHGLQIGICDLESDTLGYDCEVFDDFVLFVTDTSDDKYIKFKNAVEMIYPGLCEFN